MCATFREVTPKQFEMLTRVQAVLEVRKNMDQQTTIEILNQMGYNVLKRRVTWSGGVGSWKLMRNGNVRVQVCSKLWGYFRARSYFVGGVLMSRKQSYKGWPYAYCLEIQK